MRRNTALTDLQEWRTGEIIRLHGLPDRFLARALRDIGRSARRELGSPYDYPGFTGYGAATLWTILPGLARALGETDLTQDERLGALLMPEEKPRMRLITGLCLSNSEIPGRAIRQVVTGKMMNCFLISSDFVNGNPITSALDRVAPPGPQSTDWVARHMREVSGHRFGHSDHISWSPEFNQWKRKDLNIFAPEFLEDDPEDDLDNEPCDDIEDDPDNCPGMSL